MQKFAINSLVILNCPNIKKDFGKLGRVAKFDPYVSDKIWEEYKDCISQLPRENWYEIVVEGELRGTMYHESELTPNAI